MYLCLYLFIRLSLYSTLLYSTLSHCTLLCTVLYVLYVCTLLTRQLETALIPSGTRSLHTPAVTKPDRANVFSHEGLVGNYAQCGIALKPRLAWLSEMTKQVSTRLAISYSMELTIYRAAYIGVGVL